MQPKDPDQWWDRPTPGGYEQPSGGFEHPPLEQQPQQLYPPQPPPYQPPPQQPQQYGGWGDPGYQQPPAQGWGQAPPPPGGPGRNNGLIVGGVLAAVVLLVVAAVVGVVVLRNGSDDDNTASSSSASLVTASASAAPTTSGSKKTTTAAPSTTLSGDKPQLKTAPQVTVLGPVWGAGESTFTMAFNGWPFAFRAGGSWGCMKGSFDKIPDAEVWSCVDEGNPGSKQRVNVLLRKCPSVCDDSTQSRYNDDWLDEPAQAVRSDNRTYYVEDPSNSNGVYGVDFSRFFAERPGGELTWQVGAYAESPAETKDTVLKVLNDIATQTP